jgi:hypothetical protein
MGTNKMVYGITRARDIYAITRVGKAFWNYKVGLLATLNRHPLYLGLNAILILMI